MLSIILTASVLFPNITDTQILGILGGGIIVTILSAVGVKLYERMRGIKQVQGVTYDKSLRNTWRMPAISELPPAQISLINRVWMIVLRAYLVIAGGMLIFKMFQLAVGQSTGV
jgi:hypothetical protein